METQAGKEIADTESLNYDGGDNELEKIFNIGNHQQFDMTNKGTDKNFNYGKDDKINSGLESDIRVAAKSNWKSTNDYKEKYDNARDVKKGVGK